MGTIATAARCLFFLACIAAHVAAVNVNRTVDDQKGDSTTGVAPLFLPTDLWNIGQTCTSCVIRAGSPIDPGQVFDGTWHDATHYGDDDPDRIIQVSFTGHAVYVYHTIINTLVSRASTRTNLTFLVDSEYVGNYLHSPTSSDNTPAVLYQMLVYSNDALEQGDHTLQIVASGNTTTLILFDYIIYTTTEADDSTTPMQPYIASTSLPSSSVSASVSPTLPPASVHTAAGAIGGATAGIVSVMIIACLLWAFCLRRTDYRPIGWACTASQPRSKLIKDEDVRKGGHAAVLSPTPFTGRVEYPGPTTSGKVALPHSVPERAQHSYAESSIDPLSSRLNMTYTERSMLLTRQMRAFQAELDDLRYARTEMAKSEFGSSLPSTEEESLSAMLMALRDEMSALREAIGEQHSVTYGSHGRPPSY
ncbi:hypothetical protein C8Q73DRAFT_795208 [Cubamyces lactineus]|nr:hypothetical protein C8Q73DRAFT_795208 [Cubamyces lactineus]